jgi:hypothetical protein
LLDIKSALAAICIVGVEPLDSECLRSRLCNHGSGGIPVLHACGRHCQRDEQPHRIDDVVALSALDLFPGIETALSALRRNAIGLGIDDDRCRRAIARVFNDPSYNEPWLYHRITRAAFWTTTLNRLGIRHRRTYNTRHTYATIGLMAGVNPAFMARQLGHSLDMFFKVYAKLIDGQHDDRKLAKIEAALRGG